jgi:hypothetical protein
LQVGNHVVVENHGKRWPHKAEFVNIDVEDKKAWIRWKTTRKLDLVNLGDLTQFSLQDASPRKQNPTDFYEPHSGKKYRLTNVKMTDLFWMVAQNVYFIVQRTLRSCA